jgi:dTDP-4-dehydrorhamnose reductase
LIGNHLVQAAPRLVPGWHVVPLTREQFDLTDYSAVERKFATAIPSYVIHCAAMTKSAECQRDPARAHLLNAEVTARMARFAAKIPFIFFSTDLVFDGQKGNYHEEDSVNPLSVYAETKAEAERLVLANPRHSVIRTSLNAGVSPTGDRGFNEQMRKILEAGGTLSLFTDEFRCPIPAAASARAVWELVQQDKPGLYHLAGAERLSRWEIGQLLLKRWSHLPPRIQPGSLREYRGAARSPDTSLDCAKIQRLLSFPLPRFSEWLRDNPAEPM